MAKRKRKARTEVQKAMTLVHKERRVQVTKKYGHVQSRRYGMDFTHEDEPYSDKKRYTFDDEYRTFKRSRGRRGLNPNPNKRDPNPPHGIIGTFPIGQLMSKPIRRAK